MKYYYEYSTYNGHHKNQNYFICWPTSLHSQIVRELLFPRSRDLVSSLFGPWFTPSPVAGRAVTVFVTGWPVTRTRQMMGPPVTWTPVWRVSLWPI